jgi:hypothetical protein
MTGTSCNIYRIVTAPTQQSLQLPLNRPDAHRIKLCRKLQVGCLFPFRIPQFDTWQRYISSTSATGTFFLFLVAFGLWFGHLIIIVSKFPGR